MGKVYYHLYADDYEIPSKVAFDPEEPSLGRIRADCVAPPHSHTSIKRYISRVEGRPALMHADLFSDTSCDTPLAEGHISILRTDGPGLSPNEPMAIVEVKTPSISDGRYLIKNRAADVYWSSYELSTGETVQFYYYTTMENGNNDTNSEMEMKEYSLMQVNDHSPIILVFRG